MFLSVLSTQDRSRSFPALARRWVAAARTRRSWCTFLPDPFTILRLLLASATTIGLGRTMAMSFDASALAARALKLCDRLTLLDDVPGASRVLARVNSELQDMRDGGGQAPSASRLAGAANNIAAIEWELDVFAWAPAPLALSQLAKPPGCTAATVDAVVAGGHWWLEAKASLPFGLGSTAWIDLKDQLARLTKNARASLCGRRQPTVLVIFKHACPADVHESLVGLGVVPISAQADGTLPDPHGVASRLPVPFDLALSQPRALLLDVSSLLCLVSSSCRVPCDDPRLCSWAAANEHWSRSLQEEAERPLLPQLRALLCSSPVWLSRASEIERCDALVAMAGGEAERVRWAALRTLLCVAASPAADAEVPNLSRQRKKPKHDSTQSAAVGDTVCDVTPTYVAGAANPEQMPAACNPAGDDAKNDQGLSALRKSLGGIGAAHRGLFLASAAADACLCTANGRLVRRMPLHVHLWTYVHQARWLVGEVIPLADEEAAQLAAEPRSAFVL